MSKERIVLTYKDVISGEAEKYIGKRGHFSNSLKSIATINDCSNIGYLYNPILTSDHPFIKDFGIDCFQFFSPDPEPEDKYVPFTFVDYPMFRDKWIRINTDFSRIIFYDLEGVYLYVCGFIRFVNYSNLLKEFLFEDGSPCGKKEVK